MRHFTSFRSREIATLALAMTKFFCCARKKMRLAAGCFDKLNMTITRKHPENDNPNVLNF